MHGAHVSLPRGRGALGPVLMSCFAVSNGGRETPSWISTMVSAHPLERINDHPTLDAVDIIGIQDVLCDIKV